MKIPRFKCITLLEMEEALDRLLITKASCTIPNSGGLYDLRINTIKKMIREEKKRLKTVDTTFQQCNIAHNKTR